MTGNGRLEIGVVIAGAGARGAYEAGLLSHLLPEVARRTRMAGQEPRFWFFGTSAGSLNAALIGCRVPRLRPDQPIDEVEMLWASALQEVGRIWASVTEGRVLGLLPSGRLLGAFTRLLPLVDLPWVSLLNNDPLRRLAADPAIADFAALRERVDDGTLGAVAAATTARDGRTVLFCHRHGHGGPVPRDERRDIDYVDCPEGVEADHVLASSAIPCVFPAHRVPRPGAWAGWYYDGGVRLNTPLKPAITLGLRHLIIVGTHPDRYVRDQPPDQRLPQPQIDEAAIPVLNQLMADQLIADLQTMRSRNAADPDSAVRYLFAGPPSFDTLADLARNHARQRTLASAVRGALSERARDELSSYLLFDSGYLGACVEVGRTRAREVLPMGDAVPWRT